MQQQQQQQTTNRARYSEHYKLQVAVCQRIAAPGAAQKAARKTLTSARGAHKKSASKWMDAG